MNILLIATEAAPLVSASGLADVVYGLARELNNLTHDARIIIP